MTSNPPVHPRVLSSGGRIALIAPASTYDPDEFARGIGRIRDLGFRVTHRDDHRAPGHWIAGTVKQRLDELHAAFADPAVDAVMAIRGGYGVMTLLREIDWQLIAENPRPLVGLSDLTPLLNNVAQRAGVATLHGPMVVGFGRRTDDASVDRLIGAMTVAEVLEPLQADGSIEDWCLGPGRARGRLCGGNLSMIAATVGTPYQLDTDGAILLLEDVDEPPYRLHRLLTQLKLAGILDGCAGIGFGEMVGCDPADDAAFALRDVVRDAVADLPAPMLWGLPFGHGSRNWAFPIGVRAVLDADGGHVTFTEPWVSA